MPAASERSRIQLCGRLSIELDGVERAGALRGRQVPLLFAYLILCRDRSVGREELIGALWPHRAPRSEDAALRVLLSRLRAALGPATLDGREELVLNLPPPVWVDVEAAAAGLARAGEALARGDPKGAWALAQVPLNIASRGLMPGARADWLESRRRELADVRLAALELIGRAGLTLGGTQLASVERAARALIEAEPYRESGHVLLMQALEAQGNVAEGIRVFDRLRSLLRDELGTAPSPEAIAISERLLAPPAPARPRPGAVAGAEGRIPLPAELRARAAAPIVGRARELEQIERWLARERGESGEMVLLLAGEPGVGKTRLLAEIARRAHAGGTIVLAGSAPEESLVAFQPFLEALGHYVTCAATGELRSVAREQGPELSRLLPELRRRVPDLPSADPGDPQTERYRMFEAVVGLLGRISDGAAVLLVLDDLHWADRPSLLLLRHLARAPGSRRVALLGAYRRGERWAEGFSDALAALRHDRLLAQMDVEGLAEPDAQRLVSLRAGEAASPELVHALWSETSGNPFFIEEIVRHLSDSGLSLRRARAEDLQRFGLPPDVREVIWRRLGRLPADALEWLRVAAVLGRDFELGVLERVLGFDHEERFLSALDECLQAGLVTESPELPDRYGFVHALIRETLYDGTSSARRARLHRRVAVALRSAPQVEEQPEALAFHYARGAERDDVEPAIRYALQAAEQATATLAHEQAAEHYRRALELLDRFRPGDHRRRLELLLVLGEAQVLGGLRSAAWDSFLEAAALAGRLGDGGSLARAALGAARRYVQPPGLVDEQLIELLERALALSEGELTVARVELLSRLCGAIYYSPERRGRLEELGRQATALAAELDHPRARALAAAARRRAGWAPGRLQQRLADATELLRAAREAGDLPLALQGHVWLVVDLLEMGDLTGVDAQLEAFTSGAQRLRQPIFLWNAAALRAMRALLAGGLEEAEALADHARQTGLRSEEAIAGRAHAIQMRAIRREQLRLAELEPAALRIVEQSPHRGSWRVVLAEVLAAAGRPEEARAEVQRLIDQDLDRLPHDCDWLPALLGLADLACALGEARWAGPLYELLAPHAEAVAVEGLAVAVAGPVSRALGRLAVLLGRREQAVGHLEAAIDRCLALEAPILLAHVQLDLAAALGPSARARELTLEARRASEELGLALVARRAREGAGVGEA